jgi:hypothetical protein
VSSALRACEGACTRARGLAHICSALAKVRAPSAGRALIRKPPRTCARRAERRAYDGWRPTGKPSEELEEVENELSKVGKKSDPEGGEEESESRVSLSSGILWQSFILTFVAEWGDRSQIATIALAAQKDPYGVTAGGILGHAMCTGLAVVGGRMLAASISERTVALSGGVLFVLFALHGVYTVCVTPCSRI